MRASLSTIQQTLTPEAASVLNNSIAEAARRNHGQTTPLHVAATLLASPSGYLRQACIRSHPNSSHPLQCRALELCFSVALERLPSAQNHLPSAVEPPISNALMAALKRAQAHQRRGTSEQQQPLLAVKVELDQLIISILDDPSVSRVMREASFSSPAVKATIEESLNTVATLNSLGTSTANALALHHGSPTSSLYLNRPHPSTSEQSIDQNREEIRRVVDILARKKKRNPILVGDSEPHHVLRELLQKIEKREISEPLLRNVRIISLEKELGTDHSLIYGKLKSLPSLIQALVDCSSGHGVIIDLGDLKWLVEPAVSRSVSPRHPRILSEVGKTVREIGQVLGSYVDVGPRVWLIGSASCDTYLRCQVYHSSIEVDWDLQALSVPSRAPLPSLLPRLGGNRDYFNSAVSRVPKGFQTGDPFLSRRPLEKLDRVPSVNFCRSCADSCSDELARLVANYLVETPEFDVVKPASLPQWIHLTDLPGGGMREKKTKELEQITNELNHKWATRCSQLHPSFHSLDAHRSICQRATPEYSSGSGCRALQSELYLSTNFPASNFCKTEVPYFTDRRDAQMTENSVSTNLVLGNREEESIHEKRIGDSSYCSTSERQWAKSLDRESMQLETVLDDDIFRNMFRGLTEKVAWQIEAASAVAKTITRCIHGNSIRRRSAGREDTWLLFMGPDMVGKKRMASALSELLCRPAPISIHLGSDLPEEEKDHFDKDIILDRVTRAVERNPLSIILLENVDQADTLIRECIRKMIDSGRIMDSHGREFRLGTVIFILTTGVSVNEASTSDGMEAKLATMAGSDWQLRLSSKRKKKRHAETMCEDDLNGPAKPMKRSTLGGCLSLDLNLVVEVDEEDQQSSGNSSDLTVEHGHDEKDAETKEYLPLELANSVDETISFKPVDFGPVRKKVRNAIMSKFAEAVGKGWILNVDEEALQCIVGGLWFGRVGFEEWADDVLVPGFLQMGKSLHENCENREVQVSVIRETPSRSRSCQWLPAAISIEEGGAR